MMEGLLIAAGVALAYANGANDNFKSVATVHGSAQLSYASALALATASQLAGSAASAMLATALVKAFSGKGLRGIGLAPRGRRADGMPDPPTTSPADTLRPRLDPPSRRQQCLRFSR